jgi:hypothetical protein
MSDDKRNKSVYDLVDRMIENESPEAQQGNTLRAAALSPLVGGALERAITAYEKSAEAQVDTKMNPLHAEFIMSTRQAQVEDVLVLHKKFHGRS